MTKFFIPAADSEDQAERLILAIKTNLGLLPSCACWHKLTWRHNEITHSAVVGDITTFNSQPVVAIVFDASRDLFHVCTPTRGVETGESIMVGGHSVIASSKFSK